MRIWIDAILSILFAPECAACRRPLSEPTKGAVCEDCWSSVRPLTPPYCDTCGDALSFVHAGAERCAHCQRHPPAVTCARAIGIHDGALRAIVHALKYDGRRSLAGPLGTLMRERGRDILCRADVAVPVPLHRTRRRARGFNQAEDLARQLGLPVIRALSRVRATAVQADLPGHLRRENVRQAFRATRAAARLSGHAVVLVDDVSTTGATLDACAQVLREQHVRAVFALTAARAVMTPR